ncbi:MAG: hypothetical protein Q7S44_03110 [bacterium]|nr:hypothetical protein [bacterium]
MSKVLSMKTFFISMTVIFFFCLGLIIYLYSLVNSKVPNNTLLNSWPVTSKPVSLTLDLSSPGDNMLIFDSTMLVQGKTSPQAVVILSLGRSDQAVEASPKGDFSATLKLREGVNELSVTSFDNLGNNKSLERTVYYSKEKL